MSAGRVVVGTSSWTDPRFVERHPQEVRVMADSNRGSDAPRAAERPRELLGQR